MTANAFFNTLYQVTLLLTVLTFSMGFVYMYINREKPEE